MKKNGSLVFFLFLLSFSGIFIVGMVNVQTIPLVTPNEGSDAEIRAQAGDWSNVTICSDGYQGVYWKNLNSFILICKIR